MSINITELDASPTLRNLSKEEKQAVVRLMELAIEETITAKSAELAAMQARIEALKEVARVAWFIELNRHYYSFNNDKAAVYYMDLLKEKLDALKGE